MTSVAGHEPSKMYRKLWTKLTPSTDLGQNNRAINRGGGRQQQNKYRSLDQPNLDKIRKYINKRLNKKTTQRRYIRNPVSSIRSISARSKQSGKQSGKYSGRRKPKPWYSDGYPAFREANEARTKQQPIQQELGSNRTYQRPKNRLHRNKSIYYDNDSDVVPYYRARSVNTNKSRNSTHAPVTNEQDVIYKTYTGQDSLSLRRRPASLPPLRSGRRSGSLTGTNKSISPVRRPRNSISSLPSETAYLDADKNMKQKHMMMRSNLVKLSQDHHRHKAFKLDQRQQSHHSDTLRDLENFNNMRYDLKRDTLRNYNPKREIESDFQRPPRILTPVERSINRERRVSRLSLDPIKHKTVPEGKSNKQMKNIYSSSNGIKRAAGHDAPMACYDMNDSEFETITGTDFSTMETLSTAVMIPKHQSSVEQPNKKEKQESSPRTFPDKTRYIQNSESMSNGTAARKQSATSSSTKQGLIEIQREPQQKPDIIKKFETSERQTNSTTSTFNTSISNKIKNENNSGTFRNESERQVDTIPSPKYQKEKYTDEQLTIHTFRTESETKPVTTITTSDEHVQSIVGDTHEYRKLHDDNSKRNEDSSVKGYQVNSDIVEERNVNITENIIGVDTPRAINNTSNEPRSNSSSKQRFPNKRETVKKKDSYKNDSKPRNSITTLTTTKHKVQSIDKVVDREGYKRKGHKITSEMNSKQNKNVSSTKETDGKFDHNSGHRSVNGYENTSRNVFVTENMNEYEINGESNKNTSTPINGAIDWKDLVKKHVRQPNPSVEKGETKTVTERESETVTTETISGISQWRDLVQKYLHTKNPKIGKSTDRYFLEADIDDDDDDDIDVFERARRKYKLNVDFDEDDSEGD